MATGASRSSAAIVCEDIRRQVDHQADAANSMDTKASGLIATTVVLAALVVPRVELDRTDRAVVSLVSLGFVLVTMACLGLAIRPRRGAFSYGPDPDVMIDRLGSGPAELERDIAESLAAVRNTNESYLQRKADWLGGA